MPSRRGSPRSRRANPPPRPDPAAQVRVLAVALAQLRCRAQVGLTAPPVTVEVHLGAGLPVFSIVGLPAAAVRESKERVRAALVNSGFEFPAGRITVNLAPADLPKEGGRFDLAIAIGILLASGQLQPARDLDAIEFYGELALTGALRPVPGLLVAAQAAQLAQTPQSAHAPPGGSHLLVIPAAGAGELALLPGVGARAAPSLLDVCGWLRRQLELPAPRELAPESAVTPAALQQSLVLADVCGQQQGKRAVVVAAAGAHSLLLIGPPGCGKSMLARRLPGLLPPLDTDALLEVASIASLAPPQTAAQQPGAQPGETRARCIARPFRSPHHTTSAGAIVGGGTRVRPGEITLAHHGVLFLDELPEFDRRVLEALREPLETGVVQVSRANLRAEYPARFQLVAAMNPCPCGWFGDRQRSCRCTAKQRELYRARLSGPLLDRLDLRLELGSVTPEDLELHRRATDRDDPDARAHAQVAAARACQQRRGRLNSRLDDVELESFADPTPGARRVLAAAQAKLGMSLRAQHRCLRVARTIADLDAAPRVEEQHAAEAVALRRALSD
jgi:magnesium chelatase family protein